MKLGDYQWYKADVKFNVNNIPIAFNIIHNMESSVFMAALENWQARTSDFTDFSFCNYIEDKQCEHIAFTEAEYNLLSE